MLEGAAPRGDEDAGVGTNWVRFALAAAVIGIAIRVVLAATTLGTNDIVTWGVFVRMIRSAGMVRMYSMDTTWYWNHPPLAGYLAVTMDDLARLTALPFPFVFKMAPVITDAVVLALLWRFLSADSPRTAALGVAVFALSPDAILVSGFHGNIDPIVGAVILGSAFSLERGRHRWAGALLGLAINLKLIALVLVPILAGRSLRDRRTKEALAGLAYGAIPFGLLLLAEWEGTIWHLAGYRPPFDNWGLGLLVRLANGTVSAVLAPSAYRSARILAMCLIVIGVALISIVAVQRRGPSPVKLYALGLAMFLLFVPGFGVQWTALIGPILVASSWGWGAAWGVVAGTFIGGVYMAFWVSAADQAFSWFDRPLPLPWIGIGFVAWCVLGAFAVRSLLDLRESGDTTREDERAAPLEVAAGG